MEPDLAEINTHIKATCPKCGKYIKFVSRASLGLDPVTVTTNRDGIKPKKRARILDRASNRCEFCGKAATDAELHVGHLVSVKDGTAHGLTFDQINDDENLAAMCAECNLGLGRSTVSLRFAISLLMARIGSRS